jgi:hypothetical protein
LIAIGDVSFDPKRTYAGVVPLAMQPITASQNTNHGRIDISNLLQYALDNKIQIFEPYPGEWLEANGATAWQQYSGFWRTRRPNRARCAHQDDLRTPSPRVY